MLLLVDNIAKEVLGSSLQKLPAKVVSADKNNIRNIVFEHVSRGEKVVALYDGAWSEYWSVRKTIEAHGDNWLLYTPIDLLELRVSPPELSGIGLVAAKLSLAMTSKAPRAPKIFTTRKAATRRSLLNPVRGLSYFVAAPVLLDAQACAIQRHCHLCVDSCPRNALEGKPPGLDPYACTSCGICTWSCPYGLLSMPGLEVEGFSYFLDRISKDVSYPYHLLITCSTALPSLREALLRENIRPTVVVPVECPGWFTEKHHLLALKHGVHPVVYCPGNTVAQCDNTPSPLVEGLPGTYTESLGKALESLRKVPPIKPVEVKEGKKIPLLHALMDAYGVSRAKLRGPLIGVVRVDTSKCMVCEACSSMCPYGALRLVVEGDEIRLVFEHSKCEACLACVDACPYGAIKVEFEYDSEKYGKETVLARDEVARCIRCGAPLGSMKMMRHLEKTLREKGMPEWVIRQLWLCPKCKLYGLPRDAKPP